MVNVRKLVYCVVLILAFGVMTGCGGVGLNVFEEKEAVKPFYPPLPSPIVPVNPDPVIVTPELARTWLAEMEAGERPAFVVYGFHVQDWISLGQYDDRKDYHINVLRRIIQYLGHPDLQEKKDEPGQKP